MRFLTTLRSVRNDNQFICRGREAFRLVAPQKQWHFSVGETPLSQNINTNCHSERSEESLIKYAEIYPIWSINNQNELTFIENP